MDKAQKLTKVQALLSNSAPRVGDGCVKQLGHDGTPLAVHPERTARVLEKTGRHAAEEWATSSGDRQTHRLCTSLVEQTEEILLTFGALRSTEDAMSFTASASPGSGTTDNGIRILWPGRPVNQIRATARAAGIGTSDQIDHVYT